MGVILINLSECGNILGVRSKEAWALE